DLLRGGGAQDEEGDQDPDRRGAGGDQKREVVAAVERRGDRLAGRLEGIGPVGGDRAECGQSDRGRELDRDLDGPRREAGVRGWNVLERDIISGGLAAPKPIPSSARP